MSSRSGFPFAKVVTGLAITFGVALGLCGVSLIVSGLSASASSAARALAGPAVGVLGLIGLVAMVVTGPALVIMVIAWVIAGLIGSRHTPIRKSRSTTQKRGRMTIGIESEMRCSAIDRRQSAHFEK